MGDAQTQQFLAWESGTISLSEVYVAIKGHSNTSYEHWNSYHDSYESDTTAALRKHLESHDQLGKSLIEDALVNFEGNPEVSLKVLIVVCGAAFPALVDLVPSVAQKLRSEFLDPPPDRIIFLLNAAGVMSNFANGHALIHLALPNMCARHRLGFPRVACHRHFWHAVSAHAERDIMYCLHQCGLIESLKKCISVPYYKYTFWRHALETVSRHVAYLYNKEFIENGYLLTSLFANALPSGVFLRVPATPEEQAVPGATLEFRHPCHHGLAVLESVSRSEKTWDCLTSEQAAQSITYVEQMLTHIERWAHRGIKEGLMRVTISALLTALKSRHGSIPMRENAFRAMIACVHSMLVFDFVECFCEKAFHDLLSYLISTSTSCEGLDPPEDLELRLSNARSYPSRTLKGKLVIAFYLTYLGCTYFKDGRDYSGLAVPIDVLGSLAERPSACGTVALRNFGKYMMADSPQGVFDLVGRVLLQCRSEGTVKATWKDLGIEALVNVALGGTRAHVTATLEFFTTLMSSNKTTQNHIRPMSRVYGTVVISPSLKPLCEAIEREDAFIDGGLRVLALCAYADYSKDKRGRTQARFLVWPKDSQDTIFNYICTSYSTLPFSIHEDAICLLGSLGRGIGDRERLLDKDLLLWIARYFARPGASKRACDVLCEHFDAAWSVTKDVVVAPNTIDDLIDTAISACQVERVDASVNDQIGTFFELVKKFIPNFIRHGAATKLQDLNRLLTDLIVSRKIKVNWPAAAVMNAYFAIARSQAKDMTTLAAFSLIGNSVSGTTVVHHPHEVASLILELDALVVRGDGVTVCLNHDIFNFVNVVLEAIGDRNPYTRRIVGDRATLGKPIVGFLRKFCVQPGPAMVRLRVFNVLPRIIRLAEEQINSYDSANETVELVALIAFHDPDSAPEAGRAAESVMWPSVIMSIIDRSSDLETVALFLNLLSLTLARTPRSCAVALGLLTESPQSPWSTTILASCSRLLRQGFFHTDLYDVGNPLVKLMGQYAKLGANDNQAVNDSANFSSVCEMLLGFVEGITEDSHMAVVELMRVIEAVDLKRFRSAFVTLRHITSAHPKMANLLDRKPVMAGLAKCLRQDSPCIDLTFLWDYIKVEVEGPRGVGLLNRLPCDISEVLCKSAMGMSSQDGNLWDILQLVAWENAGMLLSNSPAVSQLITAHLTEDSRPLPVGAIHILFIISLRAARSDCARPRSPMLHPRVVTNRGTLNALCTEFIKKYGTAWVPALLTLLERNIRKLRVSELICHIIFIIYSVAPERFAEIACVCDLARVTFKTATLMVGADRNASHRLVAALWGAVCGGTHFNENTCLSSSDAERVLLACGVVGGEEAASAIVKRVCKDPDFITISHFLMMARAQGFSFGKLDIRMAEASSYWGYCEACNANCDIKVPSPLIVKPVCKDCKQGCELIPLYWYHLLQPTLEFTCPHAECPSNREGAPRALAEFVPSCRTCSGLAALIPSLFSPFRDTECSYCFCESSPLIDFGCGCAVCVTCFRLSASLQIGQDALVHDAVRDTMAIVCANHGTAIRDLETLRLCDDTARRRFETFSFNRRAVLAGALLCPLPGCVNEPFHPRQSSITQHAPNAALAAAGAAVQCPHCGGVFCAACNSAFVDCLCAPHTTAGTPLRTPDEGPIQRAASIDYSDTITVHVRLPRGAITLAVPKKCLASSLREALVASGGPRNVETLIFQGRVLRMSDPLPLFGIGDGATVCAVLRGEVADEALVAMTVQHCRDERASRSAVNSLARSCPKCKVQVIKCYGHGCHHITCKCTFQWCYLCVIEWGARCASDHHFCKLGCGCPECSDCKPGKRCALCHGCPRCQ